MRIITPARDYYDCVQRVGLDMDLTYLRTPRDVVTDIFPFPVCRLGRRNRSSLYVEQSIIGFCGKIYPVLEVDMGADGGKPIFCYELEHVDKCIETCKKPEREAYRDTRRKQQWQAWHRRRAFEVYFDECARLQDQFGHLFLENRSPLFVAHHRRWGLKGHTITFDTTLKDLEFYRVFDPYTAFQEVSMYVSILGAPNKPIPVVSDKDLAAAKGFNDWSFRTPPSKAK